MATGSRATNGTRQAQISDRGRRRRREPIEIEGFGADTRCVLSHVPSDTETQPLWSLGDKVILGLIAFVMLGTSAATFLGLFS